MVSVGSVSVKVVPDAQNFISKLQRDLDSEMKGAGERLGSRMTESMARQLNSDVEDAFKDLDKSNGKRGDEAGKNYGKSYASSFRDEVDKALRDFAGGKSIPLDVDVDDAAVTRLREKLAALQGDKVDFIINADVNTKYATAKLDELERKCNDLARNTPTVTVEFNDFAARIQIAYLQAVLDQLGARRVTIDVDFDDLDARAQMAYLVGQINELSGKRPTISFDINDLDARTKMAYLAGQVDSIAAKTPTIVFDVDDFVARMKMQMLNQYAINIATGTFNLTFDANTDKARADMAELFALAEQLATLSPTINVNAQTSAAESGMAAVDAEAHALPNNVVIDIEAEIARAVANIAIIRAQVDALDHRTADVDVDVRNGSTIIPILGGILALVTAVGAAAPAAAAGLAAVGAGIGAAGQGLAAGIIGFSGITDAIKAVNTEQDKAAQGSTTSAKTQVSNANTIANAQASLSAAQQSATRSGIQGAQQVAEAQQALGQAVQQQARSQITSAQSVADAQASLGQAVQQAARTQITSAQAVSDAQLSLSRAVQAADRSSIQDAERVVSARQAVGTAIVSANDRVISAEGTLQRAQVSAQAAQENLTKARRDAREALEDLQLQLSGGALSEERASYNLAKAQQALAKGGKDALEQWDLQLSVKESVQSLAEAKERYGDLQQEQADYARTGVNGSRQVVDAQRQVQSSMDSVADAQRGLVSAQTQGQQQVAAAVAALTVAQRQQSWDAQDNAAAVTQAQVAVQRATQNAAWQQQDSAASVAKAQLAVQRAAQDAAWQQQDSAAAVAKAQDAVGKAVQQAQWSQQDAARQVENAQRSLAQAYDKTGAAGAASGSKSAVALAKLSDAGREFVRFWTAEFAPAFQGISNAVADRMLPQIERGLRNVIGLAPLFKATFANAGQVIGDTFEHIAAFVSSGRGLDQLTNVMASNNRVFKLFGDIGDTAFRIVLTLLEAAGPLMERMAHAILDGATWLDQFLTRARDTGQLQGWFQGAADAGADVWNVLVRLGKGIVDLTLALAPLGRFLLDYVVGPLGDLLSWLADLNPVLLNVAVGAGIFLAALVGVGNVLQRIASAIFGKSIAGGLVGIKQSMGGVGGAAKTLRTQGLVPLVKSWQTQTTAAATAGKQAGTTATQMQTAAKKIAKVNPILMGQGIVPHTPAAVAAPTITNTTKQNYQLGAEAGRAYVQGIGTGLANAGRAASAGATAVSRALVGGVAAAARTATSTATSAVKATVSGVAATVSTTSRAVSSGLLRTAVGLSDLQTNIGKAYSAIERLPIKATEGLRSYVENFSKNIDILNNKAAGTPSGRTLDLSSTTALTDSSKTLTAIDQVSKRLDTANDAVQRFGVRTGLAVQSFGTAMGRGVTFAQDFSQRTGAAMGSARDAVSLLATRGRLEMEGWANNAIRSLDDLRRDVGTFRDENGRLHSENGRFLAADSYAQNQWKAVVQNSWTAAQVYANRGAIEMGAAYQRVTDAGRRVIANAPAVGRELGNSLLTGAVVGINGTLTGLQRIEDGVRRTASTVATAGTSGFSAFRTSLETGVIRGAMAANTALDSFGSGVRNVATGAGTAIRGAATSIGNGMLTAAGHVSTFMDRAGPALRTGFTSAARIAGDAAVGFGGVIGGLGRVGAEAGSALTRGLGNALLGTKTNIEGVITRSGGLVGALGGPWGIAIMGAVTLLGFLADSHQRAAQEAAAQRGELDKLKGSLDEVTGAVTAKSIADKSAENATNGLADKARQAGIDVGDLARAQLGMGDSLGRVNAQLTEQARTFVTSHPAFQAAQGAMSTYGITMDDLTQAALGNQDAIKKLTDATSVAADASDTGSQALGGLMYAVISNNQPFKDLGSSVGFSNSQLKTAQDEVLKTRAGMDGMRAAVDNVKGSLSTFRGDALKSMDGVGPVFDQFRDQLNGVSGAARDQALAAGELARRNNDVGGAAAGAAKSLSNSRDAFIKTAQDMGVPRDQAEQLANKMGLIPQLVTTKFNTLGVAEADQAMGILQGHILDINTKTGIINVDGAAIAAREGDLTNLGFKVQHLPNGVVHVFSDTTPFDSVVAGTIARVNAATGTLHVAGDPLPANATLQQVVDRINVARGAAHIDGDPLPAHATTDETIAWISRQTGVAGIGGDRGRPGGINDTLAGAVRDVEASNPQMHVKGEFSDVYRQLDDIRRQMFGIVTQPLPGVPPGLFNQPTVNHATGGIDLVRGMAAGGVRSMAAGIANVVAPNTPTLIGDRKQDDEAYIPINDDPRSIAILKSTAAAMGFTITPTTPAAQAVVGMALGGLTGSAVGMATGGTTGGTTDPLTSAAATVDPTQQAAAAAATAALTSALGTQAGVVTTLNPLVAATNADTTALTTAQSQLAILLTTLLTPATTAAATTTSTLLTPATQNLATANNAMLTPSVQALIGLGLNPLVAQMLGVLFPTLGQYQLQTGTYSVAANTALQGAQVATQAQTTATAANTVANSNLMVAATGWMSSTAQVELMNLRNGMIVTSNQSNQLRDTITFDTATNNWSYANMAAVTGAQLTAMTLAAVNFLTFLGAGFVPSVQGATAAVNAAFQGMADFVGARMIDMTTAAAAQSRFTIDFVLGDPGLTGAWNSIDAQFALGKHINAPRAGFASGGHVRGPGTETSDSIPANLSRNEFVVQAGVAKKHMPFLAALNAGQAEAIQAAGGAGQTMPGFTKSSRIPGFAAGGAVDAVNRAKVFAAQQNGKPYIWGGVGPAGYDCSGFVSAITNVLRGQNPYRRLGVAASEPWGGFAPGLNGFWSVGGSSVHTAGTLGGINAESGGSHGGAAFGGPAVGADSTQFPVKSWLPEMGGVFASGGPGGGAGFDPTPLVNEAFQATYELIDSIPARFNNSNIANGMGQGDRTQTDAVRQQALDRLSSMFASQGMGPLGTGEVMAQIGQAALPYGWNTGPQWDALLWIMSHESGFNPRAQNPISTAFGLFQFLDSTWGAYGGQKTDNPLQQSVLGMKYIQQRYGDPIGAKAFWAAHNWYDDGGEATGAGYMPKLTPEPERVLSPQQTQAFNTLVSAITEDDILKAGGSYSDGPSRTFNVYPRENQSELSIATAVRRIDSFENRIR